MNIIFCVVALLYSIVTIFFFMVLLVLSDECDWFFKGKGQRGLLQEFAIFQSSFLQVTFKSLSFSA